jgi:RNA polymerase sigma-70 factor (ECF subfamily)
MPSWPLTRLTLLDRIRDPGDQQAWSEFVALYGPLILGFIRKRVPQDEDASDLKQEVLAALLKGTYDREKGPFSKWLLTVVLNKIRTFCVRRKRQVPLTGHSDLDEHPARVEEEWEREHRQCLFDHAAKAVRAETNPVHWEAFWLTTVEGKTGGEVAQSLGLTVTNVFCVKSRIMSAIRERVQLLEED